MPNRYVTEHKTQGSEHSSIARASEARFVRINYVASSSLRTMDGATVIPRPSPPRLEGLHMSHVPASLRTERWSSGRPAPIGVSSASVQRHSSISALPAHRSAVLEMRDQVKRSKAGAFGSELSPLTKTVPAVPKGFVARGGRQRG